MDIVRDLNPLFDYIKSAIFNELPHHLTYHNLSHTENVMKNAWILALHAGLDDQETRILYVAAMLHDTGYGKKYVANEGVAAMLASKLLPDYGFNESEIELIKSMILATNLLITPTDKLESYMIDADMGYLGQEDFFEWSNNLKKEWEAHGTFEGDDKEWINIQISFLTKFQFTSKEAIALFDPGKQKHIERLKGMDAWPY